MQRAKDQRMLAATLWSGVSAALCGVAGGLLVLLERKTSFLNSEDLAAWRPPLLLWGACLVLISGALRQKWLRSRGALEPDAGSPKAARRTGWILSTAIALLTFSLVLPGLLSALATAFEPRWPTTVSTNAMSVNLEIPSMDCAGCVRSVDAFLRTQNGLEKAQYDPQKTRAVIWYDPAKISKERLITAINEHGFTATEPRE